MSKNSGAPSDAQIEQYRRDGYFLVEDLYTLAEIQGLLQRMGDYVLGRRPQPKGFAVQFEPSATREAIASDPLGHVRKIKGPVPEDEVLTRFVTQPRLVLAMQAVMGPALKLYRADFLMKPARVGSAKGVHQDSPYWPIEPYDLASCWVALDPATRQNGCMTVIPGSHRRGALPHVRTPGDYEIPESEYRKEDLIPVEMKAGTGLVFHSLLIHGTAPNTSDFPRRAVTISMMPASARYTRVAAGHDFGPEPEFYTISKE
jgi:phytanoyl-CoA hydroxylase